MYMYVHVHVHIILNVRMYVCNIYSMFANAETELEKCAHRDRNVNLEMSLENFSSLVQT